MDLTDSNLKIIFYNILPTAQIGPLSSSIDRCSTIQEVVGSINEYHRFDRRILVVCHPEGVNELDEQNLNDRIDAVYILDGSVGNIQNTYRRITVPTETAIQSLVILDAVNHINSTANAAQTPQATDGMVTALRKTINDLLELTETLNNQE